MPPQFEPSHACCGDDDYPIEIEPCDIGDHRAGNSGISWFTTRDSGRPGPHTVITALTHGNEICGAVVLDAFLRAGLTPSCGKLSLGFINVAAYHLFDRRTPYASRFVDEDLNRVWDDETLAGPRHSAELERARAVRPLIDGADYLLDIHSMQHATEPLLLSGCLDKSVALALRLRFPGSIIRDRGHAAGRRLRDYGDFGEPSSAKTALLVECGQHWASASVEIARLAVLRFLDALGQLKAGDGEGLDEAALTAEPRVIDVTHAVTAQTDDFAFQQNFRGLDVIPAADTLIARDGGKEIRTPYENCVLVMPARGLSAGQTAVRLGRFV